MSGRWLANYLKNSQRKKVLGIGWFDDHSCITTAAAAGNDQDWLVGSNQTRICSHHGNFTNNLKTLALYAQHRSNNLVQLIGLKFAPNSPVDAAQCMLAGEDFHSGRFKFLPVILCQLLAIRLLETG